jgi:methionine-gamma-lyase
MSSNHEYTQATNCVHAGIETNEYGAVIPPICQTSTFMFKNADHGKRLFAGEEDGYIYTRMRNPTVEAMENAVAALEGGTKAIGCASGMAATHLIFAALLEAGDHVICSESVYGPTSTILSTLFAKFGIEVDFVDTPDAKAVKNAIKPNTKVIYVETPCNPTIAITDLAAVSEIAKAAGAKLVVDNTFMSPVMQSPFDFGADIVMHSMTKFLNGHADVVAGIVILKNVEDYPHFRKTSNLIGGVIDPFNSFLVHRGLKTLKIRCERHCENAQKAAEFLEAHPKVDWVRFPGLKSHPQYELGKKQMKDVGALIAVELKGGLEAGKIMMDNVGHIWGLAVSLGGVESLIQHPATMTHAGMTKEIREQAHITDGLVRISVGIEDVDEIIEGLKGGWW